jgi:hypothetical protein
MKEKDLCNSMLELPLNSKSRILLFTKNGKIDNFLHSIWVDGDRYLYSILLNGIYKCLRAVNCFSSYTNFICLGNNENQIHFLFLMEVASSLLFAKWFCYEVTSIKI